MSHLGRPNGQVNEKYSLKPVVPELGKTVTFADDCVGEATEKLVNGASGGQVILLENLRFHAEEEGSSKDADGKKVKADKDAVEKFRKELTALGDIYISKKRIPPDFSFTLLGFCPVRRGRGGLSEEFGTILIL